MSPTVTILFLREKTRYTCASALCKIALRLPDPVRFDAYCFLKGLADAASLFPLVAPHGETNPPASEEACSGGGATGMLDVYRREQELLSERIENGKHFLFFGWGLRMAHFLVGLRNSPTLVSRRKECAFAFSGCIQCTYTRLNLLKY